jgi:hypothetical protein
MKNGQFLTTKRAVDIFEVMISCRREFCGDKDFIRMPEVWEDLCDEEGRWTVKPYRSNDIEDLKRKAGVIAFGDRVTLTVDERLLQNAKQGCNFSNFTLAHELGHVALDHHARSKVTKNFQLKAGPRGNSILPPTLEEREANFAAVSFQCGVALFNEKLSALELANRALTEVGQVRNAQRIVRLDVFQRELNRPRPTYQTVVL